MITDKEIEELVTGLYNGTVSILRLPQNLFAATYLELMDGVTKGFGIPEFETPAHDVLTKLGNNISSFSGCKTFKETYDMQQLLFDSQGYKKPFNVFKNEVMTVYTNYNERYLQAEYNTAINSAFSAADWVEYEADKDIFPLLQYKTVHDGRVREDHAKLHNIVKPVDDPFWDTFMPCNGWNCRCRVIKLTEFEAEETPLSEDKLKELTEGIPDIFQFNPGKRGEIFSQSHDYFNANTLPPKVRTYFTEERKTNFGFVTPPIQGVTSPIPQKIVTDYTHAVEEVNDWYLTLGEVDRKILRQYTTYGDVIMSNYLRGTLKNSGDVRTIIDVNGVPVLVGGGKPPKKTLEMIAKDLANKTTDLYKKAPKFVGTSYRGLEFNKRNDLLAKFESLKPGDVFVEPGFMSTTQTIKVGLDFSGAAEGALIEIKNAEGYAIKSFSRFKGEEEILLMPDTVLRFVEKERITVNRDKYIFEYVKQ